MQTFLDIKHLLTNHFTCDEIQKYDNSLSIFCHINRYKPKHIGCTNTTKTCFVSEQAPKSLRVLPKISYQNKPSYIKLMVSNNNIQS